MKPRTLFITIMLLAVGVLLLCRVFAFGANQTLTFGWQQTDRPGDLFGWTIEYTDQAPPSSWISDPSTWVNDARTWTQLADILYEGEDQDTFSSDAQMTSPDGETHQYWFRIRARDTVLNYSSCCYGSVDGDLCTKEIDFESPGDTINFTVTVKVIPS